MYEFHGWFALAESAEESDTGTREEGVADLQRRIAEIDWATGTVSLDVLNGEYFVRVDGLINRMRDEAEELDTLLLWIAERFPGSYGILYERADEMPEPPGPGAFRVRRMARGRIDIAADPFLSPSNLVIED